MYKFCAYIILQFPSGVFIFERRVWTTLSLLVIQIALLFVIGTWNIVIYEFGESSYTPCFKKTLSRQGNQSANILELKTANSWSIEMIQLCVWSIFHLISFLEHLLGLLNGLLLSAPSHFYMQYRQPSRPVRDCLRWCCKLRHLKIAVTSLHLADS